MYSYSINKNAALTLFLVFSLACFHRAYAQTSITLEEAISISKEGNRSIQRANQSIVVQQATYEQSKGNFLPYFGVNLTDVVSNNPLNVFGFKLLHEEVSQEDFNPALLNSPDVLNHFNLSVNAMMPLYNPEAKAEQEAVQHQIHMSESMAHRTIQGIELEVIQSYYLLVLSQNAVDVLTDTYNAAQGNYKITENYFNQGLLLKSDLLEMQIMVNQSEIAVQSAQLNLANAQAQFNYVLGVGEEVEYRPLDMLNEAPSVIKDQSEINMNRSDFKAMEHGIKAQESMVKAADQSFLPKVKAFAGFELNDRIPFAMGANNFQVGVTVAWDIYKGNMRNTTINKTKAQIEETRLELDEKKTQAQLEVAKTRREITDLQSQIKLHDLSINQAIEALKIRKNRFNQGLEKSTDIINSETLLSQKRLARLQSLYALNMKDAYLKFLLN